MTKELTGRGFKRVVVAFDASPEGRALLELAGDFAACFGSALAGIFLEDRRAGELAALPAAQEVSLGTAGLKGLDLEWAMAHQRAQLSLARRALDGIAQAHHLASSFTVHADPDDAALARASAEDLLMVCPRIWRQPARLAQVRLAQLQHGTAGGILALQAVRRRTRPMPVAVVLSESTEADSDLLAVSRVLARHLGAPLELFAARPLTALEGLIDRVIGTALPRSAVRLRPLRSGESFVAWVSLISPALVVLSSEENAEEVQGLLTEGLPLLMLRQLATA